MKLQDVQVGDTVKLDCPELLDNTRSKSPIIGIVVQVFDKLNPDGSEGNLDIDILYNNNFWIRYKPKIDSGTLTILKKSKL